MLIIHEINIIFIWFSYYTFQVNINKKESSKIKGNLENEKVYKVFIKHGNNYYDGEFDTLSITRQDTIVRIKCTITSLESHFIKIVKRNRLTYGISKVFGRVAVGNVTYTKK